MKAPSINPVATAADSTTLTQLSSQPKRSRAGAQVSQPRWLAYAVAGTAAAFAGGQPVQADIHYSGILDEKFPQDASISKSFQLDQPGDVLLLRHFAYTSIGFADFLFNPISFASFVGYYRDVFFASKLTFGRNLSTAAFISTSGFSIQLASAGNGQWTEPGKGFIGFKFNNGAGPQYGWARLKMGGVDKKNRFKLIDYAYADVGEPLFTGQTSSLQEPGVGSLGYLAFGAVGLVTWRKRRRQGGASKERNGE
jgi:hypothetical protein